MDIFGVIKVGKTYRGEKGDGYDYWGKRPLSGNCGCGKEVKRISKRIERARSKQAVKRGEELPYREPF